MPQDYKYMKLACATMMQWDPCQLTGPDKIGLSPAQASRLKLHLVGVSVPGVAIL